MDDLVKRLRDSCYLAFDDNTNDYATAIEAADRIEQLEAALKEATEYAGRLAIALSKQHYPETYGFKLVPDLLGIIDQIDHMTYSMIRIGTQSNDAPSEALGEKKSDD